MKVGFLFGAGAEIAYGMPTGGRFALEIFRRNSDGAKQTFKDNRDRIEKTSNYASKWLPEKYHSKRVSTFRDSVFENIVKGTISNNRGKIISQINNFDDLAKATLNNNNVTEDDFVTMVESDFPEKNFDDINFNQVLSYHQNFSEGNALFASKYFAILLFYYKEYSGFSKDDRDLLRDIIQSIFQRHIGAMSEGLSRSLQEHIVEVDKTVDMDLFDNLGTNLQVNYQDAGVRGLELLSKSNGRDHQIIKLAFEILENIYSGVLDYKSVIDSNWHYLYIPMHEWGKFCNINIFLHSVREYIVDDCNLDSTRRGYYDDLSTQSGFEVSSVATTNYTNNLIEKKLLNVLGDGKIIFLNGCIGEYYNPYMNSIVSAEEFETTKQFLVPLIFTQSGTKPMTSVSMLKRYVEYYNKLRESDFICSIGFGYNKDDEHINGIIRTLIDEDDKKLVIIDIDNGQAVDGRRKDLATRLKVSKGYNIHYIIVGKERKVDDELWTSYISQDNFLENLGIKNKITPGT